MERDAHLVYNHKHHRGVYNIRHHDLVHNKCQFYSNEKKSLYIAHKDMDINTGMQVQKIF